MGQVGRPDTFLLSSPIKSGTSVGNDRLERSAIFSLRVAYIGERFGVRTIRRVCCRLQPGYQPSRAANCSTVFR